MNNEVLNRLRRKNYMLANLEFLLNEELATHAFVTPSLIRERYAGQFNGDDLEAEMRAVNVDLFKQISANHSDVFITIQDGEAPGFLRRSFINKPMLGDADRPLAIEGMGVEKEEAGVEEATEKEVEIPGGEELIYRCEELSTHPLTYDYSHHNGDRDVEDGQVEADLLSISDCGQDHASSKKSTSRALDEKASLLDSFLNVVPDTSSLLNPSDYDIFVSKKTTPPRVEPPQPISQILDAFFGLNLQPQQPVEKDRAAATPAAKEAKPEAKPSEKPVTYKIQTPAPQVKQQAPLPPLHTAMPMPVQMGMPPQQWSSPSPYAPPPTSMPPPGFSPHQTLYSHNGSFQPCDPCGLPPASSAYPPPPLNNCAPPPGFFQPQYAHSPAPASMQYPHPPFFPSNGVAHSPAPDSFHPSFFNGPLGQLQLGDARNVPTAATCAMALTPTLPTPTPDTLPTTKRVQFHKTVEALLVSGGVHKQETPPAEKVVLPAGKACSPSPLKNPVSTQQFEKDLSQLADDATKLLCSFSVPSTLTQPQQQERKQKEGRQKNDDSPPGFYGPPAHQQLSPQHDSKDTSADIINDTTDEEFKSYFSDEEDDEVKGREELLAEEDQEELMMKDEGLESSASDKDSPNNRYADVDSDFDLDLFPDDIVPAPDAGATGAKRSVSEEERRTQLEGWEKVFPKFDILKKQMKQLREAHPNGMDIPHFIEWENALKISDQGSHYVASGVNLVENGVLLMVDGRLFVNEALH